MHKIAAKLKMNPKFVRMVMHKNLDFTQQNAKIQEVPKSAQGPQEFMSTIFCHGNFHIGCCFELPKQIQQLISRARSEMNVLSVVASDGENDAYILVQA